MWPPHLAILVAISKIGQPVRRAMRCGRRILVTPISLLAMFRSPALVKQTLARTINGEVRTQDAPFVISTMMMSVHGREQAWDFVKANWDQLDRLFPKQGLRRMCGWIVGLATPELERDVRAFFSSRKIDLGGKTLEQYLEQLRIAVSFREQEGRTIRDTLINSLGA